MTPIAHGIGLYGLAVVRGQTSGTSTTTPCMSQPDVMSLLQALP